MLCGVWFGMGTTIAEGRTLRRCLTPCPARMRARRFASAIAISFAVAAPAQAQDVVVFAAASLRTALDEVAAEFEAEIGVPVVLSYAGSSVLARQIIAGAPADVFISAAPVWMDVVEAEGLIAEDSRSDLLGNSLVLIAHEPHAAQPITAALDLPAMLGDGRLAMALVDAVPAGQYGKAALQSLGLWQQISDQIAQADNVRAALALVSTGEAPLGIVYASDAFADPAVYVVGSFPTSSHPLITYPAALLADARDPADRTFWEVLQSPAARAIFDRYGFGHPQEP